VYRENPRAHAKSGVLLARLEDIAHDIGQLAVPYDEWQIVYRQAIQLGRALQGDRQLLEVTATENNRTATASLEEEGMATVGDGSARSLSSRELITEITAKASQLVKKEVDLARAEIRADLKSELAMVKSLGIAAVAALIGLTVLVVAGVLALATIIPGWAAGLIVGGGVLVLAVIVGYVGWTRRVTTPLPMTRQTLKEDMQWVKERIA
jgi:hypothetical protein